MTILKTNFSKGAAIALLAGATALTSFTAFAATHPVTGEELAAEQTYTYRLLDGIPTLDPQLNEGASASDMIRDLFEGLTNQDAEGNLIPVLLKAGKLLKAIQFTHLNYAPVQNGLTVTL